MPRYVGFFVEVYGDRVKNCDEFALKLKELVSAELGEGSIEDVDAYCEEHSGGCSIANCGSGEYSRHNETPDVVS